MTFKEVRDYLSGIPAISRGGCGVAALAMYLWLKKNNKLSDGFEFVLLYSILMMMIYLKIMHMYCKVSMVMLLHLAI
jgi:phosphotransferase system  glucose/maltose/N-acetylglucosamine-specific IIC component